MSWRSDLDALLAEHGEDVTLRRLVGTNQVPIDCDCRAFVRRYDPSQLAGTIMQGDAMVIISPTDIDEAQWPGGQPTPVALTDPRVPKIADQVIIQGRARSVVGTAPIFVGSELVRINLQVRG